MLYNICEHKGKSFCQEWAQDIAGFQGPYKSPESTPGVGSRQAREIRVVSCAHLLASHGDMHGEMSCHVLL